MIKEDYVNFEISKLLKEKGFDWECISYYVDYEPNDVKYSFLGETNSTWESRCCSAPTHQIVMKWLLEVHKIIISFNASFVNSIEQHFSWNIRINSLKSLNDEEHFEPIYINSKSESFEQACESAIKYSLENLI